MNQAAFCGKGPQAEGTAPGAEGTRQCGGGAGHALGSEVREFAWTQSGKSRWAAIWVLAFALNALGSH